MTPHRITLSNDNQQGTKTEMVVMARHHWEAMDKALALHPDANHARVH